LFPIALCNIPETIGKDFYYIVPIIGILDSIAMYYYMKSLKTGKLGEVVPLQITTPLFTMFFAPILLNEHITFLGVLGIILMVFGIYCLNIKDLRKNFLLPFKTIIKNKENRYMLITAFLWSITTCLHKLGMQNSNTFFWLVFSKFPLFIFFSFAFFYNKNSLNVIKNNFTTFSILGFLNAITTCFYYSALYMGIAVYAMVIKRTSVIIGILLGAILYKELNVREHVVGAVIMLAGCLCIAM
jgi:uncharacterized membrane protein